MYGLVSARSCAVAFAIAAVYILVRGNLAVAGIMFGFVLFFLALAAVERRQKGGTGPA